MANATGSSCNMNIDGIILFEQPFAKVPYENYRKVFRTSQRNIERELTAVQALAADLEKPSSNSDTSTREDLLNNMDAMIGRVDSLRHKLSDLNQSTGLPTQMVMKERINHLLLVEGLESPQSVGFSRWSDLRLDRWLTDWCLRTGREETARKIAQEKGIQTLVDIELFTDIRKIELALVRHSCVEALVWCNENKSALRKMKSTLEFDLRLQEFIELSRSRQTQEAISYMKKHLIAWQDTHLSQIQQAAALFAFPSDTLCIPYKRLYDLSRWTSLVQSFRLAVYNLNSLPTEPLLNLALYAGLASLKLPSCYDEAAKKVDCPVCDPGFGALAEEVPLSHHVNSTIVCQISGKIMNEDNPPMAFSNGNVYSREALEDIAAKNNGLVTCVRTGESCQFASLRKVYIS